MSAVEFGYEGDCQATAAVHGTHPAGRQILPSGTNSPAAERRPLMGHRDGTCGSLPPLRRLHLHPNDGAMTPSRNQDRPLFLEHLHPPAERPQLLALLGGQALGSAGVDLSLLGPAPNRLPRHAEIAGHPLDRVVGCTAEPDGFGSELSWIRGALRVRPRDSFWGRCPTGSGVHETGSTPPCWVVDQRAETSQPISTRHSRRSGMGSDSRAARAHPCRRSGQHTGHRWGGPAYA